MTEKRAIRRLVRQRRRQLTRFQQAAAARGLFRQLRHHPCFQRSKRIALYVARDGELSPHLLLRQALAMGKHCYLPVMRRDRSCRMDFVRYLPGQARRETRYGIIEPRYHPRRVMPAQGLNLVLMPLVAFDAMGSRLGMGKGYYDRSLAFTRHRHRTVRLVGLAHECQRVEKLEADIWDVPLDMIVSGSKTYVVREGRSVQHR